MGTWLQCGTISRRWPSPRPWWWPTILACLQIRAGRALDAVHSVAFGWLAITITLKRGLVPSMTKALGKLAKADVAPSRYLSVLAEEMMANILSC